MQSPPKSFSIVSSLFNNCDAIHNWRGWIEQLTYIQKNTIDTNYIMKHGNGCIMFWVCFTCNGTKQ